MNNEYGIEKKHVIGGITVLVTIIIGIILLCNIISVPAGHKAVTVKGTSIGTVYDEGLQIKWPLNSVEYVRFNNQERNYVGSDYADDSKGSIMAITEDNVEVFIDMTIIYKVDPNDIDEVRINYGEDWRSVIIDPVARSVPRDVASHFTAFEIAGVGRSTLGTSIEENITTELAERSVIVERFALRDIRLPDKILNSIENKKAAEQNVQTAEYQLQQAEVNAQQLIVVAEAESSAIQIVMTTLNNESNTAYLNWMYMQALTDDNSNIEYIIVPSDGGIPIILNPQDP